MAAGFEGLLRDKTRPPGKAPIETARVEEVVRRTLAPPPHEATHWTARAMAEASGLAVSTVQNIWKAHGLAPHRWRSFKLSIDPFAEKLHESSGSMSTRRPMRWCWASTRSRKSRRSTAPSRACR